MKFKRSSKYIFIVVFMGSIVLSAISIEKSFPGSFSENAIVIDNSFDITDSKVVRPSLNVDSNRDKIADSLSTLIEDIQKRNLNMKTPMLDEIDPNHVEVMLCLSQGRTLNILNRLRGMGAKITSSFDKLVYAIGATVPIDSISLIAREDQVVLIEKQAKSSALLDTSTVNIGARGSQYVWDAPSPIKGNSSYSIAILDTGVDSSHADMDNFLYFQNFSDETYPSGPIGVDYGHHGTHCASIAAGTGMADVDPEQINQTLSNQFTDVEKRTVEYILSY